MRSTIPWLLFGALACVEDDPPGPLGPEPDVGWTCQGTVSYEYCPQGAEICVPYGTANATVNLSGCVEADGDTGAAAAGIEAEAACEAACEQAVIDQAPANGHQVAGAIVGCDDLSVSLSDDDCDMASAAQQPLHVTHTDARGTSSSASGTLGWDRTSDRTGDVVTLQWVVLPKVAFTVEERHVGWLTGLALGSRIEVDDLRLPAPVEVRLDREGVGEIPSGTLLIADVVVTEPSGSTKALSLSAPTPWVIPLKLSGETLTVSGFDDLVGGRFVGDADRSR